MRKVAVLLILLPTVYTLTNTIPLSEFIIDHFKGRRSALNLSLCWKRCDVRDLLKVLSGKSFPAVVHDSKKSGLLEHFSTAVVDLRNCERSWSVLEDGSRLNFFRYPFKWVIITDVPAYEKLKKEVERFNLSVSSDLLVAKWEENVAELYQPYRIDHRGVGCCEQLFVAFRNLEVDTFVIQTWGTVKCLLDYCNINYTLIQTDNFGYHNKTTGEWSGVIGDVYHGRAQLCGSSPLMDYNRLLAVNFLTLINPQPIRFVLRKPPLSYMRNIFMLPLYWTVWVAMAVVLGMFTLTLLVIWNTETKIIGKINNQERFDMKDVLLITFETLCQQGIVAEPKSVSGRLMALVFLFGFMFLYVAYSANIVALLQTTTTVNSLEQMLNSPMEVGAQDTYYMKRYLTAAKDKVRQDLYKTKIEPHGFYSIDEGIKKIRKGSFALHMELGLGYYYILKTFDDYEVCTLQVLEGYAQSPGGYACVQKLSPYKKIIKVGFLKIEEYGLKKRNYNRAFKKPKCHSKGATFVSVGIMDVSPAILLCFYGLIASLVIFGIELCTKFLLTRS